MSRLKAKQHKHHLQSYLMLLATSAFFVILILTSIKYLELFVGFTVEGLLTQRIVFNTFLGWLSYFIFMLLSLLQLYLVYRLGCWLYRQIRWRIQLNQERNRIHSLR